MRCLVGGTCCDRTLRFGERLSSDLKAQLKVANVARNALCLGAVATQNASLRSACSVLGDVKFFYTSLLIPSKIESSVTHFERARASFIEMREGSSPSPQGAIKSITHILGGVDKSLSVVRDGVLKPVIFVEKHFDLGENFSQIGVGALVFAVVKSSVKVLHYGGEVLIGAKNVLIKGLDLCFSFVKLILDALRLAKVPLHPLVTCSFLLIKSLYDLGVIWVKVA